MTVDNLLDHRQSNAQAALRPIAPGVATPEATKDLLAFLGRKADARIGDRNACHRLAAGHAHRDRSLGGVAHRVRNEVRGGLTQHVGVAEHLHIVIRLKHELEPRVLHVGLVGADDVGDELAQIQALLVHRNLAILEARKLQKRIDQARQALHFGINRAEALLVGLENAIDNGLDRRLDRHQRRAQLVGNVRRQAPFHHAVLLDRIRHGIEGHAQARHLVLAGKPGAGRKIAFLNRAGRSHDPVDGIHEAAGESEADDDRDENRQDHCDKHRLEGAIAVFAIGGRQQGVAAVHPHVHRAHLFAINHNGRRHHLALLLRSTQLAAVVRRVVVARTA